MGKLFFRVFMGIHVFLYRLTGGQLGGKVQGLKVLILTTTGRKTGTAHSAPLGHFEYDGGYVIVGSNGGADSHPAWFYNLKSNPRAVVQIDDRRMDVSAEVAGPDERRQLWARLVERAPGYAHYAKNTRREIPIVILRP